MTLGKSPERPKLQGVNKVIDMMIDDTAALAIIKAMMRHTSPPIISKIFEDLETTPGNASFRDSVRKLRQLYDLLPRRTD
jgi:hypothetical protein